MNLTIRNIPEDVIRKIRTLSKTSRRSLNSEILVILEEAVGQKLIHTTDQNRYISKDIQVDIWQKLSGQWEDNRSTEQIIHEIYESRTEGRDFKL